MQRSNPQWGAQQSGPFSGQGGSQNAGWQGPGGTGEGPNGPGPGGYSPRIDALDVLEGMLRDGFSLSNFTRIARASGSNFWIGAAIGAGAVVLLNRPDVRAAFGHVFAKAKAPESPAPDAPTGTEPPQS